MAARSIKSKKSPWPGRIFGKNGVFYTFPQGEDGPIRIRFDFALLPVPTNYYYADALLLGLKDDLQMAVLSFGLRDRKTESFADRIDVVMPMKSLLSQFWDSARQVESTVDKILEAAGVTLKIKPIAPADSLTVTLYANMIFAAVGEGESTLDFYHLSARDVHLAKTQKAEMRIQPTVRIIMSNTLTKHFFNTLRPHVASAVDLQPAAEGGRRAARSH